MTYVYDPNAIKELYEATPTTAKDQVDSVTGSLRVVAPAPPGDVTLTVGQLEPYILVDNNIILPEIPANTAITFVAQDTGYTITANAEQEFSIDGSRDTTATFTTAGSFTVYRFYDVNDTLWVTSVIGTVAFSSP